MVLYITRFFKRKYHSPRFIETWSSLILIPVLYPSFLKCSISRIRHWLFLHFTQVLLQYFRYGLQSLKSTFIFILNFDSNVHCTHQILLSTYLLSSVKVVHFTNRFFFSTFVGLNGVLWWEWYNQHQKHR